MGSHGIEPKRDLTHFLKIRFVVAGGRFYSYFKLQCIKLDKENRFQEEEKNQFYAYRKNFTPFLKMGSIPFWVQLHAYLILQLSLKYNRHNISVHFCQGVLKL